MLAIGVRRKGQLNGKSSNLNHVILNKIYPAVTRSSEVSWKDIIQVMDCDHLVKPAYFQKSCAVLLDKDVAVRVRGKVQAACMCPKLCRMPAAVALCRLKPIPAFATLTWSCMQNAFGWRLDA